MTKLVNPNSYLQNSDLIFAKEAVNQAILSIADQLNKDYQNNMPILLGVMGGAVYFTGQLLPKLTFALEFDYVQATRYQQDVTGNAVNWIVMPKENIHNRHVLICDDILDEGITLQAVVKQCYLQGAKEVKIAVLAEKLLNKSKPIMADYVGLTVPNRYVFGCGMDIYGWWRNLPEIYALKNS